MRGRLLLALCLLIGIAINTASGAASIMAFRHRHAGELALADAHLDAALSHFIAARTWQPDDSPTSVLIGRVIQQAQANGLPLKPPGGQQREGLFAYALAATTHGIGLNPADAWAWFNQVEVFEGSRIARERLAAMRSAGEAALVRPSIPAASPDSVGATQAVPPAAPTLSAEDRVSFAALFQAIELEPEFHFYRDYLAKLYWQRGMKTEAAREIRASFALWPRVEGHPALENRDLLVGLQEPILAGIQDAALNPLAGPALALMAKAMLLESLERNEEAIAAYLKLRENADLDLALQCDLNVGKLEITLGRYRESLPALTRTMEASNNEAVTAWALYYLGKAHSGLGDHVKAAEYLRRSGKMFGKSLGASVALAEEEEALGNIGVAESLFIEAVMDFPTERITYVRVIEHLRRHGKQQQAIPYAEALRENSADPGEADELLRILRLESKDPSP